MTDWPVVTPPPTVATAMVRMTQPTPAKRVVPPADSSNIGNGAQNRHPQPDARMRHPIVVPPRPDADRPTGPPPAFEANVLEAEEALRRSMFAQHQQNRRGTAPAEEEPEAGSAAHGSPQAPANRPMADSASIGLYSNFPILAEPRLDLIR